MCFTFSFSLEEERLEVDESVYSDRDVFQSSPPHSFLSLDFLYYFIGWFFFLKKPLLRFLYFLFLCIGKEGWCRNQRGEAREPFFFLSVLLLCDMIMDVQCLRMRKRLWFAVPLIAKWAVLGKGHLEEMKRRWERWPSKERMEKNEDANKPKLKSIACFCWSPLRDS